MADSTVLRHLSQVGKIMQTISQQGVRIRKSIVTDGVEKPVVKYAIESDCAIPIAFRIRETIPEPFSLSALDFYAEHGGNHWHVAHGEPIELEFSRTLAPGDSIVTVYAVQGRKTDAHYFEIPPRIEAITPIDPEDLTGDGAVPLWRSSATEAVTVLSGGLGEQLLPTPFATPAPSVLEDQTTETIVAVPAYNEAESIEQVVSEASLYADTVLVVDDGSVDETADRARAAGAMVVEHERNKGYGAALKTVFAEAKRRNAGHLVVIDGDGQHDAADIPRLIEQQETEGTDITIGSRFLNGATHAIPPYRRLGLAAINSLTNLSMGTAGTHSRILDTQCGFRAYNKQAIDTLATDETIGDRMGASIDILHHARHHGHSVDEVSTTVDYNVANPSSQHPLLHGADLLSDLFWRIEQEFSTELLLIVGLLSLASGLGLGAVALTEYLQSGTVLVGEIVLIVFLLFAGKIFMIGAIVSHLLEVHTPPSTD